MFQFIAGNRLRAGAQGSSGRPALAFLLTAFMLPGSAAHLLAQAPPDSALIQILNKAEAARWIVRVTADSTHHGVISSVGDSSVTIADHQLRLADVSLIERRVSSRASLKRGALIGGLIGAGLGGVLAAFGCGMDESNDDCIDEAAIVVVVTAGIGAGIGGLAAGFLGSSEWRTVWRR